MVHFYSWCHGKLVSCVKLLLKHYICKTCLQHTFPNFETALKGCVCYIFASMYCMFKREHLRNKEKCFLLLFESSSHSWDNQILNFWIFKCHNVIKCPSMKHKTHNFNNLGSKYSLVMKFSQFMFFIKKLYEKAWTLVPDP